VGGEARDKPSQHRRGRVPCSGTAICEEGWKGPKDGSDDNREPSVLDIFLHQCSSHGCEGQSGLFPLTDLHKQVHHLTHFYSSPFVVYTFSVAIGYILFQ
jgi:hypothetical protein